MAQDGSVQKVYADLEKKMKTSLEAFRKELNSIRTGRASLSLLGRDRRPILRGSTPLNQVATLSVPESRLITIQPWDGSVIGEVEKAILKSDLGLTPSNDGRVIKIPIPPLTEERRKQLARAVKNLERTVKSPSETSVVKAMMTSKIWKKTRKSRRTSYAVLRTKCRS